jgi:peptide/nickel transport system permease protein
MVRASMVEELRRGYVRTARLKGMSPTAVVWKHVLRNALLPTITVLANQTSWLFGGLVVVENVFNFPGLGQLLLQAALSQDLPMLEITVLLLAGCLMLANLAADILYGIINPRVRLRRRAPTP